MKRSLLALGLTCAVLFAGCGRLPEGPQEVEGVLSRVPLSLTRRGTHILKNQHGRELTYVESTAVNLGYIEGKTVTLLGTYQRNTDKRALPVLVVEKVIKGGDDVLREWKLPRLNLVLDVPTLWQGVITGSTAVFHAQGSSGTLLDIRTGSSSQLPFNFKTLSASGSLQVTPLVLGLRKAAAVVDEEHNRWYVAVDLSSPSSPQTTENVLVLTFKLDPKENIDEQIQRFQRIVKTLTLTEKPRTTPTTPVPSSGSGSVSADGRPCGGPAGILCPAGYYCAITDSSISAGICRRR